MGARSGSPPVSSLQSQTVAKRRWYAEGTGKPVAVRHSDALRSSLGEQRSPQREVDPANTRERPIEIFDDVTKRGDEAR